MNFNLFFVFLITFQPVYVFGKFNVKKIFEKYGSKKASIINCGQETDPLLITSLNLQPSPLNLPGTIIAKGSAKLNLDILGPISVSLKLIKIIGNFRLEVPCIDGFGSCKYDDICSLIYPNNDSCPDFFKKNNIPCSCPFPKGDYSAEDLELYISLPVKAPGGHYNIIADLYNQELGRISCIRLDVWVA